MFKSHLMPVLKDRLGYAQFFLCRYVYCIYDVERLHNLSDFISFFHVRGLHFEVFRMTRYGSIRGEFRNDIDYTCAH